VYTDKISIAIPVYNRIEFFEEAIDSALNQTIKCEVIVVDNASDTDYFQRICARKGVQYFRSHKNVGMFNNWNRCFQLCKTDFLLILGDDDILLNDYVKRFLESLHSYPNLTLFYTDFTILDHETGNLVTHKHEFLFGNLTKQDILLHTRKKGISFPSICATYRVGSFEGFYDEHHGANDWLWFYENLDKNNVVGVNSIGLKYRRHKSNDSRSKSNLSDLYLSVLYIYIVVIGSHSCLRTLRITTMFYAQANEEYLRGLQVRSDKFAIFFRNRIERSPVRYLPKILLRWIIILRLFGRQ